MTAYSDPMKLRNYTEELVRRKTGFYRRVCADRDLIEDIME